MSFNSRTKLQVSLISLTAATLLFAACSRDNQTASTSQPSATAQGVANTNSTPGTISIDGSSTVYPISDAIAKEYRKTPEGGKAQIEVKFSGTSGGFRRFCAGETDISNASRPISLEEMQTCAKAGVAYVELPVAFDALTLVVNPKNDWAQDITLEELKKIWEPAAQGKITNWNQVRASYPDKPLKLYGAGSASGTFDYFNEVTSGKAKASRTDYTASEDDNVLVQGIANDPNALGYFGLAYYEANQTRLKALAVDRGKGAVLPSRKTVEKAQYQPFSRPLFIYVSFKSAQNKAEVRSFVEYYLKKVKDTAPQVGYVPLPDEAYHIANVQFVRGEVGTVFEGVPQPDVTISELLRRQAVFQLSNNTKTQK